MQLRRALSRLALLLTFLASPAAAAPAATGDGERWWNGFAFPSVDGPVFCAARYRGGIAIGGRFSFVGEVETHNIAWWNGKHWEALGEGADSDVLCLIVDGSGDLLAGGSFSHMGGNEAAGTARWDGDSWSALGEGLAVDQPYEQTGPRAFAFYRDTLVAVGQFTHSGTTPLRNAAWWDGAAWHDLGSGISGWVAALAVLGDRLFAGGDFDSAGGVPAAGLAEWDGAHWAETGGGVRLEGAPGKVYELGVMGNSLVVGGGFETAGPIGARNIASWNGAAWSTFGDGHYSWVEAFAVVGDSILLGCHGNLAYQVWNGAQWDYPEGAPYGHVSGFLADPAGVLMFGDMTALDPKTGLPHGFKLLQRDGNSWTGFETWTDRMHGLEPSFGVTSLARSPDGILVGGHFNFAGNPPQWARAGGLARWDGVKWAALPPRSANGPVVAILPHEGTLYVGGPFYDAARYPFSRTPVDRLDGQTWTHLDTLSVAVNSLAMYKGELYAAGTRISLSDPNVGGVYRWNGTHWDPVGELTDGSPFPGILAMTEFDGRLVVGGAFNSIGGVPAGDVAAWDGETWQALGTALDNPQAVFTVYGLTVHGSELYATGDFAQSLGAVARWDGLEWQSVGSVHGIGQAIASADSELVVSGVHTDYGPLEEVLAWDGSSWRALASDFNGMVRSLLVDAGHLYVGGGFTRAGGNPSTGIARWDAVPAPIPAPGFALSPARPNPFQSSAAFSYQLPQTGTVRISVHDLRGRQVALIESGVRDAGRHTATWDARDDRGTRLPAGVYLVRMSGPNGQLESTKVVLLP